MRCINKIKNVMIMAAIILAAGVISNVGWAKVSPQQVNSPNQSAPIVNPIALAGSVQSIQLSNQELYDLQKLKIQRELEDAIEEWFQIRFWFIAIVALIIGYFGVRALVREFVSADLKDAMKASAEAQAAASLAKDSIKEVRAEANKYKDHVDNASETATQVNAKLLELRTRIESEGDRSVAAAEIKIQGLERQIEELKATITALANDSESHRKLMKEVDSRLQRAREDVTSKESEFVENAKTKITVVAYSKGATSTHANAIIGALTSKGYRAGLSTWGGAKAKNGGDGGGVVRIAHKPSLTSQVGNIVEIVRQQLKNELDKIQIKCMPKENPISNTDDEIAVFFD